MKIKLGQCRCMAIIYLVEEVGMVWTADMDPLEADEAMEALLAGRELYRVTYLGSKPNKLATARPEVLKALRGEPGERPVVVRSHGCPPGAARALPTHQVAPDPTPCPKGRENGAQGAARGTPAPRATSRRSDPYVNVVCEGCRTMIGRDRNIVGVQVGDRWIWVRHDYDCKGKAGK